MYLYIVPTIKLIKYILHNYLNLRMCNFYWIHFSINLKKDSGVKSRNGSNSCSILQYTAYIIYNYGVGIGKSCSLCVYIRVYLFIYIYNIIQCNKMQYVVMTTLYFKNPIKVIVNFNFFVFYIQSECFIVLA